MKRVVFVAVPPLQILDLTAPFEVFARCGGYHVELATITRNGMVATSCGLTLSNATYYGTLRGPIDTLVIPGGDGSEGLKCDPDFLHWLSKTSRRSRRTCAVCTGAFVLAAAGILHERQATTHWAWCDRLARQFPSVQVKTDPIFVKDGPIYTSAGITAGMDLALTLVEEDHGRQRAKTIARELVMYLRRSGGQSQFSEFLTNPVANHEPLEALLGWIPSNLRRNLSNEYLAQRCSMSARNFARVFSRETGVTPARFVERMRIMAVRELLEETTFSMKQIAERCGFAGIDSMRRAFERAFSVSPSKYVPKKVRSRSA